MQKAVKQVAKEALDSQGSATGAEQSLEVATISRLADPSSGNRQSKQAGKKNLAGKQPAEASSASQSHPLSAFAREPAKKTARPESPREEADETEPDYDYDLPEPMAEEEEEEPEQPLQPKEKKTKGGKGAAKSVSKKAKVAKAAPRTNNKKQPPAAKRARRKRRTVSERVCTYALTVTRVYYF